MSVLSDSDKTEIQGCHTPPDTRLNPEDTPLHFTLIMSILTIQLVLFAYYHHI
jgi:hypothetical protein